MPNNYSLHARKKHLYEDDIALSGSAHTPAKDKRTIRRKGKNSVNKRVEYVAFSAAGFFLFVGFAFMFFVLHNHHRRIIVHVIRNPWAHGSSIFRKKKKGGFHHHFYTGSPRFVTVVMPSVVNPKARGQRLEAIHQTWGPAARAIFVSHNQTADFPQGSHLTISENTKPYDPYSYPQTLLVPSNTTVKLGVPRLIHAIRTVYEKVNPDFSFWVNDHTFVIPEHLCHYLSNKDPSKDMYAGHALKQAEDSVFNSGAAGYVLSRATMKKLIDKWDARDSACWVGPDASDWLQGNPGLVTVQCLSSLGILAVDTRSQHKWHRFHAFPIIRTVTGQVDDWYHNKHDGMSKHKGFDESYDKLLPGEDCCAKTTASFHYVEAKECLTMYAARNELSQNPSLSDVDLRSFLDKNWPSGRDERGFYSQDLPKDEQRLDQVMAVLRKITPSQQNSFVC